MISKDKAAIGFASVGATGLYLSNQEQTSFAGTAFSFGLIAIGYVLSLGSYNTRLSQAVSARRTTYHPSLDSQCKQSAHTNDQQLSEPTLQTSSQLATPKPNRI